MGNSVAGAALFHPSATLKAFLPKMGGEGEEDEGRKVSAASPVPARTDGLSRFHPRAELVSGGALYPKCPPSLPRTLLASKV